MIKKNTCSYEFLLSSCSVLTNIFPTVVGILVMSRIFSQDVPVGQSTLRWHLSFCKSQGSTPLGDYRKIRKDDWEDTAGPSTKLSSQTT